MVPFVNVKQCFLWLVLLIGSNSLVSRATTKTDENERIVIILDESPEEMKCVDSSYWQCTVKPNEAAYSFDPKETMEEDGRGPIRDIRLYFLNKMDRWSEAGPEGDGLYVSAGLTWSFHPWVVVDKYRFLISITERKSSLEQFVFEVELKRPNSTDSLDFQQSAQMQIRLDKRLPQPQRRLSFGRSYDIKIALMEGRKKNNSGGLSPYLVSKAVRIPSSHASNNASECLDERAVHPFMLQERKEMASRWKASFDTLELQRYHNSLTISFFAAPPSYCIMSYSVELRLRGILKESSKIITKAELEDNGNGTLIGKVSFHQLQRGSNYTIKLIPQSRNTRGSCVCEYQGNCGCVSVTSYLFTFPHAPKAENILPELTPSVPTPEDTSSDYDTSTLLYIVMAASFFILTLILLSLALLLRLFRNTAYARKHNLLLVFNNKNNTDQSIPFSDLTQRPLLKKYLSVLLVNAEPTRRAELEFLAKTLETFHIQVHFFKWEQHKIEENMQLWIHNVLGSVDKILLFHEQRGSWLLSEKEKRPNSDFQRDLFDDVFVALHSSLVYNDPRIIHIKWNPSQKAMFCNPESMYLMPRDLRHVFGAMKVSMSREEAIAYEEEFNKISTNTNKLEPQITPQRREHVDLEENDGETLCPQEKEVTIVDQHPAGHTSLENNSFAEGESPLDPQRICIEKKEMEEGPSPNSDSGIIV